jgi:hypothetical protein
VTLVELVILATRAPGPVEFRQIMMPARILIPASLGEAKFAESDGVGIIPPTRSFSMGDNETGDAGGSVFDRSYEKRALLEECCS